MSLTYGFYNSQNSDRRYNAEQMAAIFDCLINDGIQENVGNCLMLANVSGALQITVQSGRAWYNSTWTYNDAEYVLNVDSVTASGYKRIDAVCLCVNKNTNVRANSLVIVKGTAGTNPSKPTVTNTTNVYYHILGWYTVSYGDTQIAAANIENNVGVGEPFITGILETVDASTLLAQWENDFYDWWEDIKNILDEDTVTRIYNRIDHESVTEATANLFGFTRKESGGPSGTTYKEYMTDAILAAVADKMNQVLEGFSAPSNSVGSNGDDYYQLKTTVS